MEQNHIKSIEQNIKQLWENANLYETNITSKPSYTLLDFFPYPSGIGLHVGHTVGYIATDIFARFKRMQGFNVLYAMGFDSFGLPAEQFAIQTNQHPEITTKQNIENMSDQLKCLSLSHDPKRTFSTTDQDYYKWTQWIFIKLYSSYFNNLTGKAESVDKLYEKLKSGKYTIEDRKLVERKSTDTTSYTQQQMDDFVQSVRLAYLDDVEVNWCPMLGTVLANEEVKDGKSERGDHPVEKRKMNQWMLRITSYADRLYDQLDQLNWPENIVTMQKNWIGKSSGTEIYFPIKSIDPEHADELESSSKTIFTTRPETLFGVAFIAVAHKDDHEGTNNTQASESVEQQIGVALHPVTKQEIPIWTSDYVLKEYGTGAVMAVPAHDQRDFEFAKKHNIKFKPIIMPPYTWLIENYKGNVPQSELVSLWEAHPEQFEQAYTGKGYLINPSDFESTKSISIKNQIKQIIAFIEEKQIGKQTTQYKLRDWLFSRQRYWGEPFPIVFDQNGNPYPVSEKCLPVTLPEQYDFQPKTNVENPEPPLAKATSWKRILGQKQQDGSIEILENYKNHEITSDLINEIEKLSNTSANHNSGNYDSANRDSVNNANVTGSNSDNNIQKLAHEIFIDPNIDLFTRELNTMPNWAGSCWYYLRYMDPSNDTEFASKDNLQYWSSNNIGAVDMYVGGAEHAVLHLLYSRFWHMVLFDLEYVTNPEPFNELLNPGMMTADAYSDERNVYIDIEDVELKNDLAFQISTGKQLNIEPGKMGKRYKNGLDPRKACDLYGIDIFRMHVMYMAPITQSRSWSIQNIKGMQRFYNSVNTKISQCIADNVQKTTDTSSVHKTIKFVEEEIKNFRFNTAIAALIKLNNANKQFSIEDSVKFIQMLYPFAPHLSEHLFQELQSKNMKNDHTSNSNDANTHDLLENILWPQYDEQLTIEKSVKLPVQIDGKVREVLEVAADASDQVITEDALAKEKVSKYLQNVKYTINIIRKDKPVIMQIRITK